MLSPTQFAVPKSEQKTVNQVQARELKTQEYLPRIMAALKQTFNSSDLQLNPQNGSTTVQKYVGKVRDRYDDGRNVVLVTTDRLTGFDRPLAKVPFKGAVLNGTSEFWFTQTAHIMPNHLLSAPHPNVTIAIVAKPFPVEFVVRGYITGSTDTSMWKNYEDGVRDYCGHILPEGLIKHQKLENPLVTPTTKSEAHDELISPQQIVERGLMAQEEWDYCSARALELYNFIAAQTEKRGLIFVDTKFEMGRAPNGEIILIDEIGTPDSSRYWVADSYEEAMRNGKSPQNIDKEFVRLWFREHCDPYRDEILPDAPDEIVAELSRKYVMLYELITGSEFPFDANFDAANINELVSRALKELNPVIELSKPPAPFLFGSKETQSLQQLADVATKTKTGNEMYTSPFADRYASEEMMRLFSNDKKFATWRRLWALVAKLQQKLGVASITVEQVTALEDAINLPIDYAYVAEEEKKRRHDVQSHAAALGKDCPDAASIIHMGLTSMDIDDNAKLIVFKEALALVERNTLSVIDALSEFALENKDLVTVGYTHGQVAQPLTVGRRAVMWLEVLLEVFADLRYVKNNLKLHGIQGATGTQATLLSLFNGDEDKVDQLQQMLCEDLGFDGIYESIGQTYPKIVDFKIASAVNLVGITIAKMAEDIRLLASHREIGEPFESKQNGSSSMAYKQNPMRSERICSLERILIGFLPELANMASTQWLERSLDDSAQCRIAMSEMFLDIDSMLKIALNIAQGLRVNKAVIARHVNDELPFLATEKIILDSIAAGGDRMRIHEAIREISMLVNERINDHGEKNNLIELICADDRFPQQVRDELKVKALDPKDFIGRASKQVERTCAKATSLLKKEGFDKKSKQRCDLKV